MALLSAMLDEPDVICSSSDHILGGMASMYALMSVFHAAPWLRLACQQAHPRK